MLSADCCLLDSLERPLNVFHRVAQNYRSSVWTGDGEFGAGEFGKQPLHFVLLERHVHFDGSVTSDRSGDAGAQGFEIELLILAGELFEKLMQHVLDLGCIDSRGRDLNGHTPRAEGFGLKAVMREFVRNLRENGELRRRE